MFSDGVGLDLVIDRMRENNVFYTKYRGCSLTSCSQKRKAKMANTTTSPLTLATPIVSAPDVVVAAGGALPVPVSPGIVPVAFEPVMLVALPSTLKIA